MWRFMWLFLNRTFFYIIYNYLNIDVCRVTDEIKSKFKDVKAFDVYLKNRSQEDL